MRYVPSDALPLAHERRASPAPQERAASRAAAALERGPGPLLDDLPVPTFIVDTDHVVTHMNRACAALLGIEARDAVGSRSVALHPAGPARPVLAELVADGCSAEQIAAVYGDSCHPSPSVPGAFEGDGFFPQLGPSGRWLHYTAAPLRNRHGAVIGAIQTLLDITDTARTASALREARAAFAGKLSMAPEQLLQTEKLASIGQLAAGVAHEINNPIGYICSNFSTLERYLRSLLEMLDAYERAEADHGVPATVARLQALRRHYEIDFLKQDIRALMGESREGIGRVRKIVRDLKDFSRIDTTRGWQSANLCHCIESTFNVVNNELKYKADVVRDLVDLPDVQCRPSEISQVILNLLVNAAQSIDGSHGTITIRNGSDGEMAWFEVEDTGSGIAGEHLPRIFDPFFTTKPIGKGTGLGLSISYGIVQEHHGRITVRTVVGQGSAFRVTLPLRQPDAGTSAAPGAA